MHPIFSVTLFTGQQLVLEALQRWLTRPCADAGEAQRQRRGLKGLLSLLIKTTATGVLATMLDAAIEFRRRQLLAVAAEPEDGASAAPSRFPGLGMLSRAGIASWKARLLLCIDELERRAEAYGIESTHRFSPSKAVAAEGSSGKLRPAAASAACLTLDGDAEERSNRLGRTVEQLRELVKQGDSESQRRLDDEVGSLVDLLLGTTPLAPPVVGAARPADAVTANRSHSVPAALDRLGGRAAGGLRACRSRAVLAEAGCEAGCGREVGESSDLCHICMDRPTNVQVAGCQHDLCFGCARRLCATHDHQVPQCPFCRQPIEGFVAPPPQLGLATDAAAPACAVAS